MIYIHNVPINEVKQCFEFAEELYVKNAASPKQFGRRDIIRGKHDFIADHVIGKVVEYGFKRFLEINLNISFDVDFRIWEDQHVHDEGNDLETVYINGKKKNFSFKTDIKGSRRSSRWLLIEDHKITRFNTKIYVTGILTEIPDGKEFEENPYKYFDFNWDVKILGYALNRDLVDPKTKRGWFEYRKGERLISPYFLKNLQNKNRIMTHFDFQTQLKSTINNIPKGRPYLIGPSLDCELNFGLPISWLRNSVQDWQKFKNMVSDFSIGT